MTLNDTARDWALLLAAGFGFTNWLRSRRIMKKLETPQPQPSTEMARQLAAQLLRILHHQLKSMEKRIMADLTKLQQVIADLTAEDAALRTAVQNEIARVETVIAALGSGATDQAAIDAAVAQLATVRDNLANTQATVDQERPDNPAVGAQTA